MKLDPKVVADLALPFWPKAYLRVMPKAHAATPLGMGFGQTRFAAPDNSFQLVYLARNLATAIAETIVRDRFEGKAKRVLDITEVEDWVASEVSAREPLTVIDLRTTGLLKLGVTTNAARAKQQAAGRRLSKALHDRFAVDGVLYSSRLTSAECLAVYDRAVNSKLQSTAAVSLAQHAGLIAALTAINVSVRGLA
ncbi:RES family NAD+ phosphorylase [Mesorhizobium sp. M1182]|uniref:RES family NAD+ phosphorylase n=1 Tax=Mesorhizobium sp. M1182 TaxID=2957067 RepID=UPI00333C2B85